MGESTPPGRIPFESINGAKSWALPMVEGKVANKEEQQKRRSQALKRKSEQAQRKVAPEPVQSQEIPELEEITVKPLTARELEEITQAAEQDGFEKGYNEGLEQGKAEGRKSGFSEGLKAGTEQAESEHGQWLKEQGSYLASLCESLLHPVQEQQTALADVVFDLAVGLAKELLTAELKADPSKIVPIIDHAIAALPSAEKNIRLSLHPDDLEAYQRFAPFPGCADCAIADPSLERGSCRIKSEHSYVDYSIAARLLEFKSALDDLPDAEPAPVPVNVRVSEIEYATSISADNDVVTPDTVGEPQQEIAGDECENLSSADTADNGDMSKKITATAPQSDSAVKADVETEKAPVRVTVADNDERGELDRD